MNRVSELSTMLKGIFSWNKSRIDCFSQLLLALFQVKTVNLREIALAFHGPAKIDSCYKRIKRFFAHVHFDQLQIACWLLSVFFDSMDKIYLTVDRTNWFWGKKKINLLMIAVAYEGMAIPLFWKALPKAGNASALEHQQIIQRFVKTFGQTRIAGILADREFASGALLRWLNQQRLPFYIRIKENSELRIRRKKFQSAKKLFRHVSVKQQSVFAMTIELFQQKVYLSASRSEKGELMIVATNQDPRQAIAVYLRRWEIENLFHCLKTRGFRFEETRLTEVERIEKMMGLLTIGVAWAHKVGEWRAMQKPIVFNQYRQSCRPQYSYFRYGFDAIRKLLLCVNQKQKKLFSFLLSFFNQHAVIYSTSTLIALANL